MDKAFVSFKESLLPINQIELSEEEILLVRGGNGSSGDGNGCGCANGYGCGCTDGSGCGCANGSGCGCSCTGGNHDNGGQAGPNCGEGN